MSALNVARFAAIVALVAWVLKGIVIGLAGGLAKSPLESPLFFIGLAAFVVAAGSSGLAVTAGRGLVVKILAGLLALAAGFALVMLLQAISRAVLPESTGWVPEELGLWLSAALMTAFSLWWLGSTDADRRRPAVASDR